MVYNTNDESYRPILSVTKITKK